MKQSLAFCRSIFWVGLSEGLAFPSDDTLSLHSLYIVKGVTLHVGDKDQSRQMIWDEHYKYIDHRKWSIYIWNIQQGSISKTREGPYRLRPKAKGVWNFRWWNKDLSTCATEEILAWFYQMSHTFTPNATVLSHIFFDGMRPYMCKV